MERLMTPERMDDVLADAIWWFKGFRAAATTCNQDATDQTEGMAEGLRGVRLEMSRLATGKARLIGAGDRELAIAITEAEFERIYDAFRQSATGEEVAEAFATLSGIFNQFTRERREAGRCGI